MGYRIDIDHDNCINCGVCMDVCPVQALDMTRPDRPGVEAGPGGASAALDDGVPGPGRRVHRLLDLHPRVPGRRHDPRRPWTARRRSRHARARSPGPSRRGGWIPLVGRHPRGAQADEGLAVRRLGGWRTREPAASRGRSGRRWSAATSPDAERPLPGRLPGRHRRRPLRRADRRRAATTTPTPSPPRSTRSRRSAAGSARRRARRPAAAARSTSRSPSGRSSGSPPSTGTLPPVDAAGGPPRRSASPSSAAGRPACRPPTTSPASATASRSSRRCRSPAG